MKLHQDQKNVVKSGDFEENNFTIEASAKAFMILSDGLYSNKVQAVIRELSTNAYDAHVEAGCPERQFDVHVPSRFTPEFSIRDYGNGMTHDQCMTLYTTYFRSTKNNTNDAVGCLGLGSKSPFAYADAFTVIAYQNGEKRIYAAHKGADGTPSFALLDTVATEEADGMEVKLSVDVDDIGKFKSEMNNVYKHFNVRPNLLNVADDELIIDEPEEPILKGEGWEFNSSYKKQVVMGQIAYSFDSADLDDHSVINFLNDSEGLTLRVNIGDVDITPSRESLSMNQATKNKIESLVRKVMTDIEALIQDKITNCDTLFEAREMYLKLCEQCSSVNSIITQLETVTWKHRTLFDRFVSNQVELSCEVKQRVNSRWRGESKTKQVTYVNFKTSTKFVHFDCKGGMGRLNAYLKELKSEYGYDTQTFIVVNDQQLARFQNDMGDMPYDRFIKTSDLPKVESRSSGGRSGQTEVDYYDVATDSVTSRRIDMRQETDCIYIIKHKERFDMGCGVTKHGAFTVKKILRTMYNLGLLSEEQTVYFVTDGKARQRKIYSNPNWEQISNYTQGIRTMVQEIGMNISVMLDAQDFQESSKVLELMQELDWEPTGEIGEIANALKATEVNPTKIEEFNDLQQIFRGWLGPRSGYPIEYGKPRVELDKMLEAKAPMLKFAPRWFRNPEDKETVLNYLKKKEVDKVEV